jgi:hypothetical protein
MFGFPIGNGNAGFNDFVEKFTNNADSGFPKIQQREVFYSVKNGNWNDITIWQTASGRVGIFPTANDDVYIRHNITGNISATINNLFITGSLSVNVLINITFNNIRCYGALINNNGTFRILGNENYIEKSLYQPISGTIEYQGNNQPILDLNYGNLILSSAGTKYLTQDLIVGGSFLLSSPATFDAYGYNITINGNTTISSTMNATGSGSYLFIGNVSFPTAGLNFVGNPTMEFRGNLVFGSGTYTSNTGAGNITFTTNNQSVTSASNGLLFNNPISIASGLTLTFPSNFTTTFNSTINGLGALSKLVNSGGSNLVFTTQSGCENLMSTGIYDFTTSANTITFGGNYSATIPSYFTNFHNLTITGTGTKTLGVNTTLNGNLSISSGGILECSLYNLFITGTTSMSGTGTNTLSKNSSGNITFVGSLNQSGAGGATNLLSFTGNPDIEFRNGLSFASSSTTSGTGTWTFSTNNQSLNFNILGTTINGNILVSGAITVIYASPSVLSLYGTLNGNNASSVWDNRSTLNLYNSTLPMSTGTFIQDVTATSTIGYMFNGSYNLPYTSYQGLLLSGTGTKTLSGNTTIKANLNVTGSVGNVSVLECSTSNLTINGITSIQAYGTLSKTGAGALRFDGNFGNIANSSLSLTGNPTLEFRGGIISHNNSGNYGSGAVTLSTNNQTINFPSSATFDGNITISGAITITISNTGLISNGSINGNNALSTLRMAASSTLNYRSATQPMATGILDTSTNANTWIYGLNNQDIKGGLTILTKQVYRNLTLNGTGVKTLQGYVSVLNTYTLTAPATLALNGFTLTNP